MQLRHPLRSARAATAAAEGASRLVTDVDTSSPDAVTPSEILRVEHLTKVFGRSGQEHRAVNDVSFSVAAGGSLAIVGESGSGKTTIARIVAGLESATSGTVTVDGRQVASAQARPDPRVVQMVFQDPFSSLDPRQKVGSGLCELLSIHFSLSGAALRDRVVGLLQKVGLDERHAEQLPRTLSGGQRQRVAIARALALEPKVLILDEAVSALDVSVQAQVLNLLVDIREATSVSYLFVSHDLGVVRQVTDTCLVLNHGEVVESGSTARVLDAPEHPYTQALIEAVPKPGWKPRRRPV